MTRRSKIQSEDEVVRWITAGHTYAWMAAQYLEKYNIEITPSAFANIRYRRGLDRRISRNDELIPWTIREEHRWEYAPVMLRVEARRREGRPLRNQDATRLESWKATLREQGLVVHYEPDTDEGWFYVPAREGIDLDLIRVPTNKRQTAPASGESA